jgi:multidrug resistance efflux pump
LLAAKDVTIVSKVPGEIQKIYVAEGDRVKQGQVLVQLDQRDFALALRQAKAQLAAAQAGKETAQAGLDAVPWPRLVPVLEDLSSPQDTSVHSSGQRSLR